MKSGIHPTYNSKTKVKCACGASFEIGSTMENYEVEICSKCHPFYTGKQKLVDTAGRVDKFKARMKVTEQRKAEQADRNKKKVKVESVEEKMTRKAQEKEDAKAAEKAEKEVAKKEAAKKRAEKTVVKNEDVKEEVVENTDPEEATEEKSEEKEG